MDMPTLAADVASFHNIDLATAEAALRSGVAGEFDIERSRGDFERTSGHPFPFPGGD